MQFRQQALSKLQSPEEIDLPVRFARPQGWLVLTVTVLFVIAASVWAVTGTVSSTLSAPGILTHGQGSYILQSPVAGQVTAVLAEEGKRVAANTPVLKLRTARGTTVVRTLAAYGFDHHGRHDRLRRHHRCGCGLRGARRPPR